MIALRGEWVATPDEGASGVRARAGVRWWRWGNVAPFISVAVIMGSLFFIAFAKMEIRRLGYSVWKFSREERRLRDVERDLQIQLDKAMRPERLSEVAHAKLTLRRAERGQIIQMTEAGVALEQ